MNTEELSKRWTYREQIERLEKELAETQAKCAEMRAFICAWHEFCECGCADDRGRAISSDCGKGMVKAGKAVESVERFLRCVEKYDRGDPSTPFVCVRDELAMLHAHLQQLIKGPR